MNDVADSEPLAKHGGRKAGTAAVRLVLVVLGLLAWFWTQWLIGQRGFPEGAIGDGVLDATGSIHALLLHHPAWANALLITSSALIDLLGIFLLAWSVFGPTLRPFVGLLVLFLLRQICQALCALPPPSGMIWAYPGVPSLLVTYGVSNDLFFSGHTAISVYGATELARQGRNSLTVAAVLIAIFQVVVVLLLRAHYTMDVYAGAISALWVATIADRLAQPIDGGIARWLRK